MQHNRNAFFLMLLLSCSHRLYVFFFFVLFACVNVYVVFCCCFHFGLATAKTTINRGYKTHSFKQAIHLVVVKQSHSFYVVFLFWVAIFSSDTVMHFHLQLQFTFIVCSLQCVYARFFSTLDIYIYMKWSKRQRKKVHCIGIHTYI